MRVWLIVLAVLVLITPAVLFTALLTYVGIGLVIVMSAFVCSLSAGFAWLLRWTPQQAVRWAAGGSIIAGLALGITLAVLVHSSDRYCDAFCFSEREAKIIAFVTPASYGVLIAITTWVPTEVIVGWIRRHVSAA